MTCEHRKTVNQNNSTEFSPAPNEPQAKRSFWTLTTSRYPKGRGTLTKEVFLNFLSYSLQGTPRIGESILYHSDGNFSCELVALSLQLELLLLAMERRMMLRLQRIDLRRCPFQHQKSNLEVLSQALSIKWFHINEYRASEHRAREALNLPKRYRCPYKPWTHPTFDAPDSMKIGNDFELLGKLGKTHACSLATHRISIEEVPK
ncbi:hypothetical protein VNO77_03472 [Canavalia gladiata]|uniref:Uncharacterized protein n=1 Tax=Canavalia gladiata TaxID=3824 RepID=A0AAN9R867_CANGL